MPEHATTMFAPVGGRSSEPRPPRQPYHADAEIVAHDDGEMFAELTLTNRTARPAPMWIGGAAVIEPVTATVRGNAAGSVLVPVRPGTLEVHHEGPSGSAIMVGEVPNPYSEGEGPEEDDDE